jgi:hypothetical protein
MAGQNEDLKMSIIFMDEIGVPPPRLSSGGNRPHLYGVRRVQTAPNVLQFDLGVFHISMESLLYGVCVST